MPCSKDVAEVTTDRNAFERLKWLATLELVCSAFSNPSADAVTKQFSPYTAVDSAIVRLTRHLASQAKAAA